MIRGEDEEKDESRNIRNKEKKGKKERTIMEVDKRK